MPTKSDSNYNYIVTCKTRVSQRLETYLNFDGFLEKSLKIKSALKILEDHPNALKSPRFLLFSVGLSTVDRDLNQYKIVVPFFGAAYAEI